MTTPVDVVVCAHNEAATIEATCRAVLGAPSLGSLFVVADACTDGTVGIVARLMLDEGGTDNLWCVPIDAHDKGTAMATGVRAVTTPTVAFVDADLDGLTTEHVETLLTHPPHPGMVVGLRDGYPVAFGAFPSISGERRIPTRLAREVRLAGASWRAEQRINAACVTAGLPWAHVVMRGVKNPPRRKVDEWRKVGSATLENAGPLARMLARTRRAR